VTRACHRLHLGASRSGMLRYAMLLLALHLLLATCNSEPMNLAEVPEDVAELPSCSLPLPPGMIEVSEGEFWQGCDPALCPVCAGAYPERKTSSQEGDPVPTLSCEGNGCMHGFPFRRRRLGGFAIDATEATVTHYSACVEQGGCVLPTVDSSKWGPAAQCNMDLFLASSTSDSVASLPMNCVSWQDAYDFCHWQGKRLCSEAEWEKAARGPYEGRVYPWTSAAVSDNFFWGKESDICDFALVLLLDGTSCEEGPVAVGSKPGGASPYGALDMCGSVAEWVADWYDPSYYFGSAEMDPKGPASGARKVLRGGSTSSTPANAHTAFRGNLPPDERLWYTGIRCCWHGCPVPPQNGIRAGEAAE
jgi:formylglycine-generating enzyme required for sulfatase activity